ncbi:MAG: hypothetical protein GKR94_33220 [Gammaproteobacteria bacterium]|nr:hypothetical protein [Gammaproteobacteria bacterium]
MRCWLIRHARTAWNAVGRVQVQADIALDATGVRQAAGWRLPAQPHRWFVSAKKSAADGITDGCGCGLDDCGAATHRDALGRVRGQNSGRASGRTRRWHGRQ